MKKTLKITLVIVIPVALIIALKYPSFHRWARAHVNEKTAVEDHPLNCTSCHFHMNKTGIMHQITNTEYYSPFNLAVSKNGERIYVVAEEGDALLVVDVSKNKVIKKIKVGNQPHSVILNRDETRAYVSNQWSNTVSVIDLNNLMVIDALTTGDGPAGLALSANGSFLYVVDSYSSNLSVIDLLSKEEIRRLTTGNNPTGIQATPDGSKLLVTSRRSMGLPYNDTVKCEITVVDDQKHMVVERKSIEDAYMMENISFTPSGDLAFFTMIRPKNNITTVQVDRGWMMTHGFGVIEMKPGGRTVELLIDEPNHYFADPFDIVVGADGGRAYITSAGVNYVSVISVDSVRAILAEKNPEILKVYANNLGISSRYMVKRIPTGANPKGMALTVDGERLYVAEHLQDRIAIINTKNLETEKTITLGGPGRTTVARQGRRLMNNAGGTFQSQFSCYTCHPDAHEDGLAYNMASKDMGRNVTNTQSLREVGETAPYKWNGKNATVYKQDGMRFSTVLTRNEPFNYDDLDALASYIMTGIDNPPNLMYNPNGQLTKNQLLGKAIFERTHDNNGKLIPDKGRCVFCHPAPYYTNRKMFDVGTLAATDDSILFDTPHLNNIYASSPYLHDGRAKTLEEIWTKYGKTEQHGIVNDLTKMELNYLVEYLKSLRSPEYENKDQKNNGSIEKEKPLNDY
jgi:YVTN family beta-propeller protein